MMECGSRSPRQPSSALLCGQTSNEKLPVIEKPERLALVLDLDQTLLDTKELFKMTREEKEFLSPLIDSVSLLEQENPSGDLFLLKKTKAVTKLRPFVRTFLEEASQLFDLYIFTKGTASYASDMLHLLDPNSKYFDEVRVFSRDNGIQFGRKSLSVIPVVKTACLIVDDLEAVWPSDKENLIQIREYHYFPSTRCSQSWLQLKSDESDGSGILARVLEVLRRIHAGYFEGGDSDVREILRNIRQEVLRGVRVLFSVDLDGASDANIRKKAAALGAVSEILVCPSVTHVVTENPSCMAAVWADHKEGTFLVNPQWIEVAYCTWERPSESMYRVTRKTIGQIIK